MQESGLGGWVWGLAALCTCPALPFCLLPLSFFPLSSSLSFLFLFFFFTIIPPSSSLFPFICLCSPHSSSPPHALHPPAGPPPPPLHFHPSLCSFKPQPRGLALASWCPFPQPPVLCAPCLGALSPSQLGGQALPPARPCAAALGTLWWMGAVSWVPSGSTSDPVPLSPQKVEEVGAWALGQGAGLAPPPFLPAPPLSPRATHSPSPLRGVGGDITLPAKELSIKIPLLPPQLLALPPPPPQGREGSVLSSTLGSPPFPTKFRIPPDHPLLSTPRCHCSF